MPVRRPPSPRALLWGALFFAAAQLALTAFIEGGHPGLADPEYGGKMALLRRRLREEPGRPLVVLLGDSRAAYGFRPEALPPLHTADGRRPLVFNLSLRGSSHVLELCCLHRLLDQGIRPDWLLIEVVPPHLHLEAEAVASGNLLASFRTRWADLPYLLGHARRPWLDSLAWLPLRLVPWYQHRFQILGRFAPEWRRVDDAWRQEEVFWADQDRDGWVRYPYEHVPAEHYRQHTEGLRQGYGAPFTWTRVAPAADRALREMLDVCRREGIRAALVLLPEASDFRGWYSPATRRAIDAYLADLSRDHGVPLADASAWLPDDCFSDAHHLLPRGADALSERFGREVLAPLLRERRGLPPP
jgi:hypothetical protein